MNGSSSPRVNGKDGFWGYLDSDTADLHSQGNASIRLQSGQLITVPASLLAPQINGSFLLPLSLEEIGHATSRSSENVVVPVVAEELRVGKRLVETGTVRIRKTVAEHDEVVDEPLLREKVVVETVPVNRIVEGEVPSVRHEGDTMIIPVLEEVLVVEKRMMLKEELHVRREQETYHAPQTVTLRTEAVQVTQIAPEDAASP